MSDVQPAGPHFVVNARTTGARALRELEGLREAAERAFPASAWLPTESAGHAVELARTAAEGGSPLLVAVGGDGTINEVVNGLLAAREPAPPAESPRAPRSSPTLGILPFGSGSDFVKTLGIPRDPRAALEGLQCGRDRRIDVGVVECAPLGKAKALLYEDAGKAGASGTGKAKALPYMDGGRVRRYFVNIAGCGASGRVVERFNRRQIPGTLGYVVATLTAAMGYRWPLVNITIDDQPPRSVRLNVLFVCNAEYCGGGMHVGLGARLDDGLLRVVEAANVSRLRAMLQWPRLYRGGLERTKGIRLVDGRVVRVSSGDDVLVDADGELCGRLPATYTIVRDALTVRVP